MYYYQTAVSKDNEWAQFGHHESEAAALVAAHEHNRKDYGPEWNKKLHIERIALFHDKELEVIGINP